MKSPPSLPILTFAQRLAGTCDAATGLLLLATPAWTLSLMGIRNPPASMEWVSWVGAFVLSVGLAYLLTSRLPRRAEHLVQMRTVWLVTGLSRALVAGFLTWKMLGGQMEPAWTTVALTDGVLAAIQFIGIQRGWLSACRLPDHGGFR